MYNLLIVDTLNFAYQTFDKTKHLERAMKVNDRVVYPLLVRDMVDTVRFLEKKYSLQEIFFLYDNPTSRDEIKKMFFPLSSTESRKKVNENYKASRKKANIEFYNSVDLFRLYFMVEKDNYHSVRITNLEADDLIPPCIQFASKGKEQLTTLLLSNDSDWCKYLNETTHILTSASEEPLTPEGFLAKRGFYPKEEAIILQKILEGDSADNVPAILKDDIPQEIREYIILTYDSIDKVFHYKDIDEKIAPYSDILSLKEREMKSIYQMLATIPITEKQFLYNCVNGRNSQSQKEWLERILYETQKPEEATFTFNAIKVPRKNP